MTQLLQPGAPNLLLTSLLGWLVLVNLMAFSAFMLDHRRAVAGQGMMPETQILLLAMLGGWLGAQLGRMAFRVPHERAFGTFLNLSILPILACAALLGSTEVDWSALVAKGQEMIAAQTAPAASDQPVADAAVQPTEPAKPDVVKPAVKSIAKTAATKDSSLTANPDLPKRIGPGSKTSAWHSR